MSPKLLHKPLHYDRRRRRLWIRAQGCHHGATGVLLAATGLLLMAHDWKDRAIWFARGGAGQRYAPLENSAARWCRGKTSKAPVVRVRRTPASPAKRPVTTSATSSGLRTR